MSGGTEGPAFPVELIADMARRTMAEDEADKQDPSQEAAAVQEPPKKRARKAPVREAAEAGPDPWLPKLERAESLAASGAWADAAEAFAPVVAAQADNLRALQGLGSALFFQGKYDAAEKELRKALKLAPDEPEVNYLLGHTLYKRGVYAAAATQLRRAVELEPEHGSAWFILGEALNQMAESDAAIEALEEAVRLVPENGKAFYAMGIAYDRKGNHDRAAEMYRLSREGARA